MSVLCYHCCHSCPKVPLQLPWKYDVNNDTFLVEGFFCSWECMKSYNLQLNDFLKNNRFELIQLMYKKYTGNNDLISFAPKRDQLELFGGSMTIQEFRKNSKSMLHYNIDIVEHKNVQEDTIKIQKTKKKGFNLAASMGITKA